MSSPNTVSIAASARSSTVDERPQSLRHSDRLYNEDLAPAAQRWGAYNIAAFWMSDVHSVGGYLVAASLFALGLSGWQVMVSLLVGIVVVQWVANIIAAPSQKAAVPFPVICRMSFGVLGANVPALVRGVIAVFWYGIQTFLASSALMMVLLRFFPAMNEWTHLSFLGLSQLGWLCFGALWAAQALVFWRGMDTIRRFIDWSGPAVYVVMFIMAGWLCYRAGWSNIHFTLGDRVLTPKQQLWQMVIAAMIVIGYFSGPTLNFGDFSRYARSMSAVRKGNFWGLPVNFLVFAATTVAMVSATLPVFGEMIDDPIATVARLDSDVVVIIGALTFVTTTIGINIVANFVSPAFDFSNVAPRWISFRMGGMIAAVGSVALMPWKMFANPELIHYTVEALAAVIGPIYGILLVDYYHVQHRRVDVDALFSMQTHQPYWYRKGVNPSAIGALVVASVVSLGLNFAPYFGDLHHFSLIAGALTAAGMYALLARNLRRQRLGSAL